MAKSNHLFKKGNKQWQRRSKHGVEKIIKSPRMLLETFEQYTHWCDENPLMESKAFVVSDGKDMGSSVSLTPVPKMRAYTLAGFCVFMGTNRQYWGTFKAQLKPNSNNTQELIDDFNKVIAFIEDTMYQQKFEGAAAGMLKENIISRELGLADKTESTNINFNSVDMSTDDIKKISKELDDEF